jgi:hypothetical protein
MEISLIYKVSLGVLTVLLTSLPSDIQASDHSTFLKNAEQECEKDPLSEKCKKYLDGRYRKHNDAEKKDLSNREDILLETDQKKYEQEVKNELLTFCRKNQNAPRCASLTK